MNPFLICLLMLDVGAAGWFLVRGRLAWSVIYMGAALIQAGSVALTR